MQRYKGKYALISKTMKAKINKHKTTKFITGAINKAKVIKVDNVGITVLLKNKAYKIGKRHLSWAPWQSPHDLVKIGDILTVKIRKVNGHHLSLSVRDTHEDIHKKAIKTLKINQIYSGLIVDTTPSGYWVKLDCGARGFLHKSETLAYDEINIQEKVNVRIIKIDAQTTHVNVSRKRIPEAFRIISNCLKLGDPVQGPIVSHTDYGIFIRITNNYDALAHKNNYRVIDCNNEALHRNLMTRGIGKIAHGNIIDINQSMHSVSISLTSIDWALNI